MVSRVSEYLHWPEVFCIVLCWETRDRLAIAEEGVEASNSTNSSVPWILRSETNRNSCSSSIQSEMATVEELVQMMNTLLGQQHALNQEISRLTAENQQFRQAVAHQGCQRLRLQLDKQFRPRFPMRTHDRVNEQSLIDIKRS